VAVFLSVTFNLWQFPTQGIITVRIGVAKRRWQTEIIQDRIEEADEKFEVLLVSPEATIIGSINKAELTIRDSGGGKIMQLCLSPTKSWQSLPKPHMTVTVESQTPQNSAG